MNMQKTTYSKKELAENLAYYDLVIIYQEDFSPIVLKGEKITKINDLGILGFAFRKDNNKIEGIYWKRDKNSYNVYSINAEKITEYFVHNYFLSLIPELEEKPCSLRDLLDKLRGEKK